MSWSYMEIMKLCAQEFMEINGMKYIKNKKNITSQLHM